ncbi:MAG: hypothetical protein ABI573_05675 [Chloroflexota bacterium]
MNRVTKTRAALVLIFGLASVVGAYLDWIWWVPYVGIMITIAAVAILVPAGLIAAIGRGKVRSLGIMALAVGIGLLAGQGLGPGREPLIQSLNGTMTVYLDTPIAATASGSASCLTVASGTEISVNGDSNMHLDTPDEPFLSVYLNKGDRWEANDDSPRMSGVRLELALEGRLARADGKPLATEMEVGPSSTVVVSFTNSAGSIRFADLVAKTGADSTGESVDISGRIEWTCQQEVAP